MAKIKQFNHFRTLRLEIHERMSPESKNSVRQIVILSKDIDRESLDCSEREESES